MKIRFKYFFLTFLFFVLVFALQKPLFMLFNLNLYHATGWNNWLKVIWNGLPLDFSLAGYLSIIPGLLLMASIWSRHKLWRNLAKGYFAIVSLLLSVAVVVNIVLYPYWGFPLDSTPLFYFFTSPKDAMASVSGWMIVGLFVAIIVCAVIIYRVFNILLRQHTLEKKLLPLNRPFFSLVFLILLGLLIIPIRGGFGVSTMNVGKVYFSEDIHLNHAATNPLFSLMASMEKQTNFKDQYRFMKDEQARKLVKDMLDQEVSTKYPQAPTFQLLNTQRPNVLFIVMESFSAKIMKSLGGLPDVAVHLDSLSKEGLLFRNFYATSFRTDRGLVSILSGFPSQPTTSVMKMPKVSQNLQSITAMLRHNGYSAQYYYGGDANFTNMRSYLMGTGFQKIVSDQDFPSNERLSKWGVHDHLVFEKLLADLRQEQTNRPWFKVIQTSSSHEPFDVPYHRLDNKILNAFAYADNSIGHFIGELKKMPQWKNTLVVLVADHLGCYPQNIDNLSVARYHIPLIFLGGALKGSGNIDIYGSQTDIAATLLGQMGIGHQAFPYSKDIFNSQSPHFAFFTFPDAFGLVDSDNQVIYNNESKKVVVNAGKQKGKNLLRGKAYLQEIYNTIAQEATGHIEKP